MILVPEEWLKAVSPFISTEEINVIWDNSMLERSRSTVYPAIESVFKAFHCTLPHQVKCVIVGQDPYHGPNQAMGLSFSVPVGMKQPPSLRNMMVELYQNFKNIDLAAEVISATDLTNWTVEGVFLLNRILTVEQGLPLSHAKIGWQKFTEAVIESLNLLPQPIVYILMGKPAQELSQLIKNPNHLVLKTVHPSPLSAYQGYFGCEMYLKANEFLENKGIKPINWLSISTNKNLL